MRVFWYLPCLPLSQTSKSHLRAEITERRGSEVPVRTRPGSFKPSPSGVMTPSPFRQFYSQCLENCVRAELPSLFLTCWKSRGL